MVQALGFSLPHAEASGSTADEALPQVLNVYQLGSRVYQTAEPGSDWYRTPHFPPLLARAPRPC
jgi:hypothetical protein